MAQRSTVPGRLAGWLFRPALIPALIAAVVVALFGLLADRQDRELAEQRVRADVLYHLNLIRAKLEGNIQGDILLARGLAAAIATEPDMDQARFAALAEKTLGAGSEIRHLAGAPDLVVSLIYPLEGNEKALGLDYRENDGQREAALLARDHGSLVVAGPVDLVQGGRGLIVRVPIISDAEADIGANAADGRFWGILSTVIDVEKLYANSGLLSPDLPIEVAIVGRDALGAEGERFYGDPATLAANPITEEVALPWGSWHMAAIPKGGWEAATAGTSSLWLITLAAGILVVVPTFLTGRLVDERRHHVAELKSREIRLERLSRRLGHALDISQVGVWELDLDTGAVWWDDRMNELYGYPQDGGVRTYEDWCCRVLPEDRARVENDVAVAARDSSRYESEFRLGDDGEIRIIRAIGSVYVASDGSRKLTGVNWDVTADVAMTEDLRRTKALTDARNAELERARARIEHDSLHDFLTGLPNRMYLEKVLGEHAARCHAGGGGIVLLHLDLDRFKEINDTLGHPAGDALLIRAAETIRNNLAEGDFVARTGGDEFVVVCQAEDGLGTATDLADRLIADMRQPVTFKGNECRFGVSIGIDGACGEAVDRERLLVNADIALYRAKNRGRNRYEIFTSELQAQIVSRKATADSILKGLENGEFIPHFQPQFDARSFQLVGVEALARWRHPERGILASGEFVQIAEEINALAAIDRTILEQGLAAQRRWRELGLSVGQLSVNVSSRRLHDEQLIPTLRQLEFEPGMVSFELVESIYLDESDQIVRDNIKALGEIGIHIEIDDFGTGYASIVSLMNLKPRRLKIDRQIIQPIIGSKAQVDLVRSILEIGRALDIEVVAEGVETMAHARLLRDMGCDVLQGFALGMPMSAADIVSFASTREGRAAS